MKINGLKAYLFLVTVQLYIFSVSFSYAQSADLLRQRYLQQRSRSTSEANIDIPSISEGEEMVRSSEILPEEVPFQYPDRTPILLDGKIDPTKYVVGPGDILLIYLWGEIDRSYPLRIYPEGNIIIPAVGSLMVADLTLTEAKEKVKDAVEKKYKNTGISLYLDEPRRFRLYVSGIVYVTGMHESHGVERVSDIMERAGLIMPTFEQRDYREYGDMELQSRQTAQQRHGMIGQTSKSTLGRKSEVEEFEMDLFTLGEKKGSSSRSIVIHRNGKKIPADLLRFTKLGDLDANPYVNSGDRIEVPPYKGDISIYGQVNDEGVYEYKSGDRIIDLVGFGGGLTSVADTSYAIFNQFDSEGVNFSETIVNLYDALYENPDDPRYLLHESDRLYVRKKYDYKTLSNATINGEVKYPGQYAIKENVTTLSELITMAGGFTGNENLEEARLIRRSSFALRNTEYERLKLMQAFERTPEENDYMRSYERTFEGSINTDFARLFREKDFDYDVVLHNGDNIYIPIRHSFVNIIGAVRSPGLIKVLEGANVDYYIEKAGGYNWNANPGGTAIIKARSSQRYKPSRNINIEEGDSIHVPEKVKINFWVVFRDYSSLFTQIATLFVIINQVAK